MLKVSSKAISRFERKFIRSEDGCWEWTACKDNKGYGSFWLVDRQELASRVAYSFYIGCIPAGLHVLHRCDNPGCVRPDHLYAGTQADNIKDRDARHRRKAPTGPLNGRSKLTEAQVFAIRSDRRPLREIATEYEISVSHAHKIRTQKRWAHV